ncbi:MULTISPECIES: 23S rRNA (uracil(747)-C(5))-methyltransferase RlmC [unclassified Gilliamella]|uniref:23S rRNA (uracil(747)-C(5))-methyltransferase RlmC n=1 Tax=unclassified Gilliamella TaxID=2685620 RepID=UPI001307963C|nr:MULTISPECIES: 23S rRNA (uracil(747)-C(5))-methyltransferase RlmC [unclassified Gilliamella]MWP48781.1 23S rRNA (uracil(747)-C(5))-methyltransferase RlmC [Gilliamella sp. Lep-s35]MWP68402.1 23S rRNA (uracil(747)-C(5))-methyltransferase RlmC [Gilliamella sp. Lep-s5]MWP77052.1 23S rRNA (uracil(747)-C(5))-methyltransferase RlmC [Gilliamella sp. Lep-s21]
MQCHFYQQKKCLSCHWINHPYQTQLERKQTALIQQLSEFNPIEVKDPFASKESAFRNKAKMVVLGTVEKPILGIQTGDEVVDLCDCPLYSNSMQNILKIVRTYIRKQGLVPYNINKRKGELKFVIITESSCDETSGFMLRFVLRSHKFVEKIKHSFHQLQEKIQNLQVVSINIQPNHSAILEGDEEIELTQNSFLSITLNKVPLFIKSKSFFQTNTYVASNLYKTASDWVTNLNIKSIWDLFCGVGGFGLSCVSHSTKKNIQLTGIEISPDAIECATLSAKKIGFKQLVFKSFDATQYAITQQSVPDLVLLNPPRRGAGKILIEYLEQMAPNYILYSSCNLFSLVDDLTLLSIYQIQKVQLFDMFPHTSHMEVLVLLQKKTKN